MKESALVKRKLQVSLFLLVCLSPVEKPRTRQDCRSDRNRSVSFCGGDSVRNTLQTWCRACRLFYLAII